MKRLAQRSAFAVFAWVITLAASSALAQFAEMTSRVPESANMISLINVEQVLASPMAVKEGWDQDPVKRFAAGLTNIPSGSNQLLFATQMDIELTRPVWELGMIQLDEAPSATELAEKHGGTTDSVAGFPAVRLSDDSYVIRFSDKLVGGYTPGNRQAVSRWICSRAGRLPPYLQEAIGYATRGAEFIIALDLKDAVATEDARRLTDDFDSQILKDADINPEDLADLLASVQGVMLGITFNERAFGKIKVDFDRDASMLSGIAKPLFLEILEQRGLMIDEFHNWKAEVEGKRGMFGGYLTASGLMRLSSLVDLPTRALHDLPSRGESEPADEPSAGGDSIPKTPPVRAPGPIDPGTLAKTDIENPAGWDGQLPASAGAAPASIEEHAGLRRTCRWPFAKCLDSLARRNDPVTRRRDRSGQPGRHRDTFRTPIPPPDDSARGNCGTHASPQPGDGPVGRVGHADRSADRCGHRRNPPFDGQEIPG